jgi:TetR/AcrR family transcriptional regulator, tetracycline repressor protein
MIAPVRAALSRDVIARTALELTDEHGLSGLSMRKLGSMLGVEAMSLYHYVTNKDDLLDAVLDCLYSEIQLPRDVPIEDWETATRLGLRSFRSVLTEHGAALELFSSRPAKTASAFDVLLWSHGRFEAVGLDVTQACKALHFGVSFVMGHVASELGTMALLRTGFVLDPTSFDDPGIAEFLAATCRISSDEMFDFGLEAVVAGLRSAYHLP